MKHPLPTSKLFAIGLGWSVLTCSFSTTASIIPLSMTQQSSLSELDPILLPPQDTLKLLKEDNDRISQPSEGLLAPRFAKSIPFKLSPSRWDIIPSKSSALSMDRAIWRVQIISPGATSLNVSFNQFHLPQGSQLFIYTPTHSQVLGPFTETDNKAHKQFWSPLLFNDEVIIELSVPLNRIDDVRLTTHSIQHGFRPINEASFLQPGKIAAPKPCSKGSLADGCDTIHEWQDISHSVSWYTLHGTTLCSGIAVNNSSQNGRPLFLTPTSCGITQSSAATIVSYWNQEKLICENEDTNHLALSPTNQDLVYLMGSTWKAKDESTGISLIEFDYPYPAEADVYLSGWNFLSPSPHHAVKTALLPTMQNGHIFLKNDDLMPHLSNKLAILWSPGIPQFNKSKQFSQFYSPETLCPGDLSEKAKQSRKLPLTLFPWLDPFDQQVTSLEGMNAPDPASLEAFTDIENNIGMFKDIEHDDAQVNDELFRSPPNAPSLSENAILALDVIDLSSTADSKKKSYVFYVFTPINSKNLQVYTSNGSGNLKLKLKNVSQEYSQQTVLTSDNPGTEEYIHIDNPNENGTYKILIKGQLFSGVDLKVTYELSE